MHKPLKIGTIKGITLQLHYSWWIIVSILAWSLSAAFFPQFFPGYTTTQYWVMGVLSALLLFISVFLHELSHSFVALIKGIKVNSITLFFFGGVAGIQTEDLRPSTEFFMAIAGPLFSLAFAFVLFLLYTLTTGILQAILFYLYQLNFILAVFNIIPAYPLDGGRAFRALLHAWLKDLARATQIAAFLGRIFGLLLIALGIFSISTGGGLWLIFLGAFIFFLARASQEQTNVRVLLKQLTLKEVMRKTLPTVSSRTTAKQLIQRSIKEGFYFRLRDSVIIVPDLKDNQSPQTCARPLKLFVSVKKTTSLQNIYDILFQRKQPLVVVKEKSRTIGYVTRSDLLRALEVAQVFVKKR